MKKFGILGFKRNNCDELLCSDVLSLKYVLKLYDLIIKMCNKYNICFNIYEIFDESEIIYCLNGYQHIMDKHDNLYKNDKYNIFKLLCNNNECKYNIRHRNNNNNNNNNAYYNNTILDDIHFNLIHYQYNIQNNNNNNKYNKFVTEIDKHLDTYDYGKRIDYYGDLALSNASIALIKAKYRDFKQEMLINTIETLSYSEYDGFYRKATSLSKKYAIKQIKAKTSHIPTYFSNIVIGSSISTQHILAIILYTDTNSLTYKLRKTFRLYENGKLKSDKIIISDVSEYFYWGKLLYECVSVYGKYVDVNQEYYQGLSHIFTFNAPYRPSNMPLSTTTQIDVANNFMGPAGMVLTYLGEHSKCLSVKCFSKFSHEEEVLFFKCHFVIYDLYIPDYYDIKGDINTLCQPYLLLFSILFGMDFKKFLSKSIQHTLIEFLKYIMNPNSKETNAYFGYYKLCLKSMVKRYGWILMNGDYILNNAEHLNTELLSLLFEFDDTLTPGIFIENLHYNLNAYCLYCHVLCEPITLNINLKNAYENKKYTYLSSTKNGFQFRMLISIVFYHNHHRNIKFIYEQHKFIYSGSDSSNIDSNKIRRIAYYCLTCPSLNTYTATVVDGYDGAYHCSTIIDIESLIKDVYQFKFSLCLKFALKVNNKAIRFYDYKYGM